MANAGLGSMRVEKVRDAELGKFHFVVKDVPTTDPFRWGLYFGDMLTNLRGALDHVAYALGDKDSPGRGEDRDTQFILVPDAAAFSKARWHLKHLSQPHQDMIGRADDRVRAGYRAVVERYIETLQAMLGDGQDSRRQALIAASTLVGALALSRAVDDEALSKEILSSARDALRHQHTRPRSKR
jgi:hypothetical protein